jgi:uncharacterized protein (TIGR02001 family)
MKTRFINTKILIAIGLGVAIAVSTTASADDTTTPQFAFDLTPSSDYVFRGVSQTENDPVLFAWSRVSYNNFYATLGAENVDFNNSTDAEYDVSVGWSKLLAGYTVDLGVIRYGYVNAPTHIDTVELRGIVSHPLGPVTLGVSAYHTSNYFGSNNDATYVEGNAAYPITAALSTSVAYGHQSISGNGQGYSTWNAGLGYALNKHCSLDLRYYDTVGHAASDTAGNHIVASVRLSM